MNTINTKGFTEMTGKEMIKTDGGCRICRIIHGIKPKPKSKKPNFILL